MTVQPPRTGHVVKIRTVDHLMRDKESNGVIRRNEHRTTIAPKDGKRVEELSERDLTAPCPNLVWVAASRMAGPELVSFTCYSSLIYS